MILQDDFKRLVAEQLKAKGWSRSQLAREMGVSPQYVTNYLNGLSSAGDDVKERFFDALGFTVHLTIAPNPVKSRKVAV